MDEQLESPFELIFLDFLSYTIKHNFNESCLVFFDMISSSVVSKNVSIVIVIYLLVGPPGLEPGTNTL